MGCITGIFGLILPRFALLAAWVNDQAYWNAVLGSQLLLGLGFIALPWTTLIYGFAAHNGMTFFNWILVLLAFLADIGTYGIGFFGGRKEYSSYRGA
jgi:hypothetical protein